MEVIRDIAIGIGVFVIPGLIGVLLVWFARYWITRMVDKPPDE